MSDLHQLRCFVSVVDHGGFAAAARQRGLSAPAVTRAVAALEDRLGVRLLHRTTRSLRLTEAGGRFLDDCRRALAELDAAEAAVRGAHREPQGELSVTAPTVFGRLHVAPLLMDFAAAHPRVQGRLLLVDRVVHLLTEGVDVALRIGALADSSYTAVAVGRVQRIVVASPAYLARRGEPRTPADLAAHDGLGLLRGDGGPRRWELRCGSEAFDGAPPRLRLATNSADAALQAAVDGHGLASLLSYQARDALAQGRLVRVLRAHEPAPLPVHLVYSDGRRADAKVRAFVDFAAARLRAEPALRDD